MPSLQEEIAVSSLLFKSCVCAHKQFVYGPKHCYYLKIICTGISCYSFSKQLLPSKLYIACDASFNFLNYP